MTHCPTKQINSNDLSVKNIINNNDHSKRIKTVSTGALGLQLTHPLATNLTPVTKRSLSFLSSNIGVTGNSDCVLKSQSIPLENVSSSITAFSPKSSLLEEYSTSDVALLSLVVNELIQNIFNKNTDSICNKIQYVSEVQDILRARQLKNCQEKINKIDEYTEKEYKADIFSVICDWAVSSIQLIMGTLRVIAGDVLGGISSIMNGVTGLIKDSAETALLCGANKETCKKVIFTTTVLQTIFGSVSMMGNMANIGDIKNAHQSISDSNLTTYLGMTHYGIKGINKIQQGLNSALIANIQKQIDKLIVEQCFTKNVQKWLEERKKTEYKKLQDTLQDSFQLQKRASRAIDNYGSTLSNIVVSLA